MAGRPVGIASRGFADFCCPGDVAQRFDTLVVAILEDRPADPLALGRRDHGVDHGRSATGAGTLFRSRVNAALFDVQGSHTVAKTTIGSQRERGGFPARAVRFCSEFCVQALAVIIYNGGLVQERCKNRITVPQQGLQGWIQCANSPARERLARRFGRVKEITYQLNPLLLGRRRTCAQSDTVRLLGPREF